MLLSIQHPLSSTCYPASTKKTPQIAPKLKKYPYFTYLLMRRIVAILLLLVFMFNLFGYKLIVSCMVNNANQSLETALDKNEYAEDQLISIKKPINLPYYNNSKDFTRTYGEVEMNGISYQYVKSRIYNDSLELLCIPNTSKQQLLNAKDDFAQATFDLQKDANKKAANKMASFAKLFSEYEKNIGWNELVNSCTYTALQNTSYYKANSGTLHKATIEQPPDALS
jgi:hypothetical protein